ncbi:hypothetical protein [Actinomadura terrae]|uniref:hypothetical protein n=1 Tax=Actinomadura terrae TaxID=604353 RepID=UPI001FA77D0D|nr:hypothetical protein [Actinomadura terrae]
MNPINLDPHPVKGHSGDRTIGLAGAVADAVRALNYATLPENAAAGVPYPSTVGDVVGRLQAGAAGMDQLVRQLAGRLTDIAAHEELRVAGEMVEPTRAVAEALDALETVRKMAAGLEGALRDAHNALSPIGVVYTVGDDPDQ